MSLINFTVKYSQYANSADDVDTNTDLDIIGLVGETTFTPVVRDARPILAPGYSPPAGFRLRAITGFLDGVGVLRASRTGPDGVRLVANDPVLQLPKLSYRVEFKLTTPLGEPVRVDGGYFSAPQDDRVIYLAEVLQAGGSIGGPRISSGDFEGDSVIFENEDGTTISAIAIPPGILVFVDNGDSTWSVG